MNQTMTTAKGGKRISGTITHEAFDSLDQARIRLRRHISPDIGGKETLRVDHIISALIVGFLEMDDEDQLAMMRRYIPLLEAMRREMKEASGAEEGEAPVQLKSTVKGLPRKRSRQDEPA